MSSSSSGLERKGETLRSACRPNENRSEIGAYDYRDLVGKMLRVVDDSKRGDQAKGRAGGHNTSKSPVDNVGGEKVLIL
jgi:hypothetical protein